MSIGSFDTGTLRIRLKAAEDKVKAFESGEKYVQMQKLSRARSASLRFCLSVKHIPFFA